MRIISLAPSCTEIICALGAQDLLVARTRFCNYPLEIKTLPTVSGWLDVDFEALESFKPDIIFTSNFLQDKIAEECRKRNLVVVHTDPLTLEDVYASIRTIGKTIGKEISAQIIVQSMKQKFESLRGVKGKVYVEEWHKPPNSAGNWVPDVLQAIGCDSVLPSGVRSREVSAEEIKQFDPDLIVLSWCGFGNNSKPEWVKQRWPQISAIARNRMLVLDDSLLNRPGPRLVEAAEAIAATLPFFSRPKRI